MSDHLPITQRPARTAAERRSILEEYDSYPRGDARRGALLCRHSVYTSQLAKWRQHLTRGETTLEQLPGPKPQVQNPLHDEIVQFRRENARLKAQLAQARV